MMNEKAQIPSMEFPDFDPDVMDTSDAKAILSHYEELYPELNAWMQSNNILLSYLFRHVNAFMDNIEAYKREGFRLQSSREFAFLVMADNIKRESAILIDKAILNENATPSVLFDLDFNDIIDTDHF